MIEGEPIGSRAASARSLLMAIAIASCGFMGAMPASAQVAPAAAVPPAGGTTAASADCPAQANELPVQALYGRWQARFDGMEGDAVVMLNRHPEYEGGVRGSIDRGGQKAELAGDIADDGLLTLDESQDGRSISAVWSGELEAASCGRLFKGTWRDARDDATRSFMLRKTSDESP